MTILAPETFLVMITTIIVYVYPHIHLRRPYDEGIYLVVATLS